MLESLKRQLHCTDRTCKMPTMDKMFLSIDVKTIEVPSVFPCAD